MQHLYLVTKLFNVDDRITSLNLCEKIDQWIDDGILVGLDHCYLPYRDSNNEIDPNDPDISHAIFALDVKNLKASVALTGFLNGPSYDPGIGFELGFAFALGKPIVPMTTDYFKRTIFDGEQSYSTSKYLSYISDIIHVQSPSKEYDDYRDELSDIQQQVSDLLKTKLTDIINHERGPKVPPPTVGEIDYDYYIDPNYQYSEAGLIFLEKIKQACTQNNKTFVMGDNAGNIAVDIANLAKSENVILIGEEFEPDVDMGIIQGLSYGLGKNIYMYSSQVNLFVQNESFSMNKNPMNKNSATQIFKKIDDLVEFIASSA